LSLFKAHQQSRGLVHRVFGLLLTCNEWIGRVRGALHNIFCSPSCWPRKRLKLVDSDEIFWHFHVRGFFQFTRTFKDSKPRKGCGGMFISDPVPQIKETFAESYSFEQRPLFTEVVHDIENFSPAFSVVGALYLNR